MEILKKRIFLLTSLLGFLKKRVLDFAINYLWNFEESEVRETKEIQLFFRLRPLLGFLKKRVLDFAINYLWNFEESEVRETKKNMISLQLFSFSTFGNLGVDFSINRTNVSERLPILRSYTTFVYKFWLTMRYKTSLKYAIAMPLHQAHWHLQLQEFTLFKSERGPAKNPSSLGSLF